MKQGLLAFQYEQEQGSTGMTGLSGLMTYVELMQAAGLRSSVERHMRLRERGQGWSGFHRSRCAHRTVQAPGRLDQMMHW